MILFVFAVRDRASDHFGNPQFMESKGAAIRLFSDGINNTGDKENLLAKHPDDFDLYELGTYNSDDGSFVVFAPKQIILGRECIKPNKE